MGAFGRETTQTMKIMCRTENLMDHMMRHVEQYAKTLEKATIELKEEKQRADLLLYRMLPRLLTAKNYYCNAASCSQVATALKNGQKVEPEHYDAVTIMFSDVVKFTNLAARSTPLQVTFLQCFISQLTSLPGGRSPQLVVHNV